ncbi:hypothetical protein GCM10010844_35840 [Deinococcus radiotolerans]|uniref:PAS domain-containing protein n=2 Tax=Deinococcus radiotolerans TaxID=1309407 RepID=A0ABQ2FPE5_9DEIO|nr:hypothetical protein GCM10010844_35840 [Deinococcus radiotolerans]
MMLTRETKRIQQEVALSTAISHQALLVEQMARQAWHLSAADAPDVQRAARAALQRSVTDLSGSRQSAAGLLARLARSGNAADINSNLSAQLHTYQTVASQLTRTADGPAAERAASARWMDQQASGGLAAALQETQRAVERSSASRSRRLATFTWYRPVIVLSLLVFLTLLVFRPLEKRIQRVQDELVQERDFALQVMTTVGQGLSVTDTQGRFEYVNPAYARLLNDTPDNLLGRTPFDVTFEGDHDRLRSVRAQRQEGETSTYETRLKRADGRAVPVLITGSPRLSGTQWAGTIAAITDLSAHKETEQAIRILAALSHSLELERTPDGVTERALQVLSEAIDLAWLVLYVRDGSTFRPTLTSGAVPPEIWAQLSRGVPQGEGRIWDTLNGQAVYMDESARPDYAALGVGSVALIPLLRSTGDVTQVLCAFHGSRAQGWTEREQVLLDTAARSISAALERAELHQEAQNNAAYAETLLAVSPWPRVPSVPSTSRCRPYSSWPRPWN